MDSVSGIRNGTRHAPRHFALSDAQWALIEDFFPRPRRRKGRPWRNHRTVLDGIFWVLSAEAAGWRDLPERFGPWQTIYDRYTRYQQDGTFDRILKCLDLELDAQGLLVLDYGEADAAGEQGDEEAGPAKTVWRTYRRPSLYELLIQAQRVADVKNSKERPV